MTNDVDPRIQALKDAVDNEVHGLWLSTEMAVKVLAAIDAAAEKAKARAASEATPR